MFSWVLELRKKFKNSYKKVSKIFQKNNWYLFPQQARDSTCHCLIIFNFALLQKIKAGIIKHGWRTQEDWIGITFPGIVAWQQAMDRLTNPKIGDNIAFHQYQQNLFQNGIHLDQIYTASGRKYYKSELNPLKNLQKIWLSPYHFVCTENHPDVIEKTLPLYSDGKEDFIFDIKKNCYQKLEPIIDHGIEVNNQHIIYLSSSNKMFKLTEEYKNYLNLPNYTCLTAYPFTSSSAQFKYGYKYQYLPKQAKENVYFHVGLFQLLNLAMGIDRENNFIDKHHELYLVYKNLRDEMTKSSDNPWGLPEFNAQNSLEYHVTEIFKKDPDFMQEVIDVNSYPFNTFEHYEQLDNLYNSRDKKNRKSLADQKQLLPCKEQMLAYSFSQALLVVWAAALSEEALYAVLELPMILRPILYFANINYQKNIFRSVYNKSVNNSDDNKHSTKSFMLVWKKIKEILQAKGLTELFSFDGHGVVISFSEDLMIMQNDHMSVSYPEIIADLGFTVIDSLYSEKVKPWYVANHDINPHQMPIKINPRSKTAVAKKAMLKNNLYF